MTLRYENSYDTYKCKCGKTPGSLKPRTNGIAGPRVHPETKEPWCTDCKNEYEARKAGYVSFSHKNMYVKSDMSFDESVDIFTKVTEAGFDNLSDYNDFVKQKCMEDNNLETEDEYILFKKNLLAQNQGYRNNAHKLHHTKTANSRQESDDYFDKIFNAGFDNATDYYNFNKQQTMEKHNLKTEEEYINFSKLQTAIAAGFDNYNEHMKYKKSIIKEQGYVDFTFIQYGKSINQLDTICVASKEKIYTDNCFKSSNKLMGRVNIHHDKVSNNTSVDKCGVEPSNILVRGSFKGNDAFIYELIGSTIMNSSAHTGVHNLGGELDIRCYKTSQLKYALQSEKKYLKVLKFLEVNTVIPYEVYLKSQINPKVPNHIIRKGNIIHKVFGTDDLSIIIG